MNLICRFCAGFRDMPKARRWAGFRRTDTLHRHLIAQRRAHPARRRPEHPDGRTPPGWPLPPLSRPGAPDRHDDARLLVARLYHRDDNGAGDAVLVLTAAHDERT
jgi:isoamylase